VQFKDVRQVEWDDVVEAIEQCYELGWTDGLPMVPPTVERVAAFLEYVGRAPDDVLGMLPERRRAITVGKVAANAVMAGCKPEYFPVVIAATEAMSLIFTPHPISHLTREQLRARAEAMLEQIVTMLTGHINAQK